MTSELHLILFFIHKCFKLFIAGISISFKEFQRFFVGLKIEAFFSLTQTDTDSSLKYNEKSINLFTCMPSHNNTKSHGYSVMNHERLMYTWMSDFQFLHLITFFSGVKGEEIKWKYRD